MSWVLDGGRAQVAAEHVAREHVDADLTGVEGD